MKKHGVIAIIVLIALYSTLLSGCDVSLEIVKAEITSYPNKIVYVKDVDSKISVEGIAITATTRGGIL